jgi:hypothetical protein
VTDFAIKANDKETMWEAYRTLGIISTDADGNETLQTSGLINEDTGWALVDQGVRTYPTGETIDTDDGPVPTYVSDDAYWVVLRWNGGAPLPDLPEGVEIAWRSDAEEPGEYPAGLTRFA